MKKNSIAVLLGALLATGILSGQSPARKIIQVEFAEQAPEVIKEFHKLGIDIGNFDRGSNSVTALVSDDDVVKIAELGLKSRVVISDADAFARQLRETGYLENFHSYDQMLQEMNEIVSMHPEIALLEDIGDSYEKTVGKGGNDIWVMKISDNVQMEENEPEVFYFANIHAREIITPEIIMYFMHYLIDNYGIDPYVTHLINHRQIWLCPTGNPDGHEVVMTGADPSNGYDPLWWRKNKRDNNNNGIFEMWSYGEGPDGVDLNRNFGYKWGIDNQGSSPQPSSATYRGSGPFSEPESQAIRDFVTKHNFIITLSFHSYSQLWLYPWGYTYQQTPDHQTFVILADSCVVYNNYTPETAAELYLVNGDTDDWLYGEQTTKNKIYAFTPEVGSRSESISYSGFFPDTMYIDKQILENQGPMLFLAYAAGEEPVIEHEPLKDTESQGPFSILAKIKQPIVLTTPVALDKTTPKVFYNATGVAPFDSIALFPTENADEFSGEIPILPLAQNIYYYLSATDQNGRSGLLPRGAPMATFSFKIGADNVKPTIDHTPITFASIYATAIVINAFIADNIGIATAKLFYRKNNASLDSLDMTTTTIPNEYQAILVPTDLKEGDIYDYQILAIDNSQNRNRTQLPEAGFYQFYVKNSLLYDFELEASFIPVKPGDWQWGAVKSGPNSSHSGSKLWGTNLSGNYSDLTESILETPEISLVGKDSVQLTFWHWYLNEYSDNTFWDGGNVKISVDGGEFGVIEPIDGYDGIIDPFNTFMGDEPCFGGPATNGNFWHQEAFDLSQYGNHVIKIRFHFASDQAVSEPGWYIDDVELTFKNASAIKENTAANSLPDVFELRQNYPNPFNPATTIEYSLPQPGEVTLSIVNLLGEQLIALVDERQAAGSYSLAWNGKDKDGNEVASGIYFYRFTVKGKNFNHSFSRKMVKLQ